MNKTLLAVSGLFLTAVIVSGAGKAYAQTTSKTLIEKLANRFNLSQSDVQSVFDEFRDEKHQMMRLNFSQRLDQAVKDGRILEEKKQLLIKKMNELRESFKAARDARRQTLQDWASQNGIDLEALQPYLGGFGMGRGMRHGFWMH